MKKTAILLVVALMVSILAGCAGAPTHPMETESSERKELLEEKDYGQKVRETHGSTVQFEGTEEIQNAYRFIIDTMEAPQYWSDEDFILSDRLPWKQEEAEAYYMNLGVASTGWKLLDEDSATFIRDGFESSLSLNFRDHVAVSTDKNAKITRTFDFKKKVFTYEYGITGDTGKFSYEDAPNGSVLFLCSTAYSEDDDNLNRIEPIFEYYERIFAAAGCPLLEQPTGTLQSYKNKEIRKPEKAEDGLIHAPWEQEEFRYNWRESDQIVWLDDYREIFDKASPDKGTTDTMPWTVTNLKGETMEYIRAPYSPRFLACVDKNDSDGWETDFMDALSVYYVRPVVEDIYGYNATYFVDAASLAFDEWTDYNSEEEFLGEFTSTAGHVYPILRGGTLLCDQSYSETVPMLYELVTRLKDLSDYYDAKYRFGEDYISNFQIVYSQEAQKFLGLR